FGLGNIKSGRPLDRPRELFLSARQVDAQEPCRSCWARYFCGGGCHAEVMRIGRTGCDAVRGWLDFCMQLYPEVLATRPDLLEHKNELSPNYPAEPTRSR